MYCLVRWCDLNVPRIPLELDVITGLGVQDGYLEWMSWGTLLYMYITYLVYYSVCGEADRG